MIEFMISEVFFCCFIVECLCCLEGCWVGVLNEEEEFLDSIGEEFFFGWVLLLLFFNCGVFFLLLDLVGVDLICVVESEVFVDL